MILRTLHLISVGAVFCGLAMAANIDFATVGSFAQGWVNGTEQLSPDVSGGPLTAITTNGGSGISLYTGDSGYTFTDPNGSNFDSDDLVVGMAYGAGTGTLGGTWDVSWDFTVNLSDPDSLGSAAWTLTADVDGQNFNIASNNAFSDDPQTFVGSTTIATAASADTTWSYEFSLDVNFPAFDNGDSVTVTLPPDSTLDVLASSATPEPGTMLLLGTGLLGLAGCAARRRRA